LQQRFAKDDLHAYEVRPRKDHRGVDLISNVLPFGRLWYGEPSAARNAVGCAKFYSRSHHAVIRVYDAGNVAKRNYNAPFVARKNVQIKLYDPAITQH
jgi:hypothetical protein